MKRLSLVILKDLEEIFQVKDLESPIMIHKKGRKMLISLSSWGHGGRVWTRQLFNYLQLEYGLWIDKIEPLEETVVLSTFTYLATIEEEKSHPDLVRARLMRHFSEQRVKALC